MVCNVVHPQTKAKQTVMGFVEYMAELFIYHQGNATDDDYNLLFNAMVDSIKTHEGRP